MTTENSFGRRRKVVGWWRKHKFEEFESLKALRDGDKVEVDYKGKGKYYPGSSKWPNLTARSTSTTVARRWKPTSPSRGSDLRSTTTGVPDDDDDDGVRHIDIDLAALRKEVDSDGVVSHDNYQGFVWLFEAMEKGKDGRKDDLIPLAGGFPSGKVYNDGATPVKAGHYLVKVNGKTFEDADGAGELMDAATNEYSEEGGRTYLTLSFATKIEKESGGGKGKGGAKDKAAGSGGDRRWPAARRLLAHRHSRRRPIGVVIHSFLDVVVVVVVVVGFRHLRRYSSTASRRKPHCSTRSSNGR